MMFEVSIHVSKLRGAGNNWVRRGSLNAQCKFEKKQLLAFDTIDQAAAAADEFMKSNCKMKVSRRGPAEAVDSLVFSGPRVIITDQFFKRDMNRPLDKDPSKKVYKIEIASDDPDFDPDAMLTAYNEKVGDSYG